MWLTWMTLTLGKPLEVVSWSPMYWRNVPLWIMTPRPARTCSAMSLKEDMDTNLSARASGRKGEAGL